MRKVADQSIQTEAAGGRSLGQRGIELTMLMEFLIDHVKPGFKCILFITQLNIS